MRRSDICLYLGPADRTELQALLSNRNTPRKLAWRADIVLATADGQGTVEIMRRTGMSKPTFWRWQERFLDEGVPGLKRDKTRPSRVPPLPREVRLKVIAKTVQETPPNATHWSRTTMADAVGISPSSVGRITHQRREQEVTLALVFRDGGLLDAESVSKLNLGQLLGLPQLSARRFKLIATSEN